MDDRQADGPQPDQLPVTDRTTLRRLPRRGSHERQTIYRILDEGLVCHVGFSIDGQPYVIPTVYGRIDDRLYLHGAVASRMLKTLAGGAPVCVTVTLVDGLVLARSAFHHSMNYRSVVLLGTPRAVLDGTERDQALQAIVEHIVPGRSGHTRAPNAKELAATSVLCLPIDEGSAKVRSGPPLDDDEDYALPLWAGEIPVRLTALAPVADPRLRADTATPDHVTRWRRGL
jgi:hypothetical protein